MNRRPILITLAIALLVVVFVLAKRTASWRPVKLAQFQLKSIQGIKSSSRYVVLTNNAADDSLLEKRTLFDLQTGQTRELAENEGITGEGNWRWELQTKGDKPQLLLRQGDAAPVAYALRADNVRHATAGSVTFLRVRPDLNRVELVLSDHIYRWNQTTGEVERSNYLTFDNGGPMGMLRDSETLVGADWQGIRLIAARTGHASKPTPIEGVESVISALITPFGSFALLNTSNRMSPKYWKTVDVASGRVLWSFDQNTHDDPIFSLDEKELAVSMRERKIWEIRDLQTGQILRTLPLVPNAQAAAFSPDGNTLYSVANGVLYRQRAR